MSAVSSTDPQANAIRELIRTVIYAVVVAFLVRTLAFEPFNIPSGSMIPTLLVGDYLFVSKYSYGYSKYTITFGFPLFEGRIWETPPKRGDVAVFKLPSDNQTDYIKRVIGLPHDNVQVENGQLLINGEAVERIPDGDYTFLDTQGNNVVCHAYTEVLPNGVRHPILKIDDDQRLDHTQLFRVPDHQYFMMGDNRDNSLDSRTPNVGFVPEENLVGRAEFLFFSLDERAHFWEVWKWPWALRFDRMFTRIR